MGEESVNVPTAESRTAFTHHLLRDVQALEYMLKQEWFETDTIRIGAEQEMCIVDKKTLKPCAKNVNILRRLKDEPWATTEIARFNIESNFTPRTFTGKALSEMEAENHYHIKRIQEAAKGSSALVVLTGILPTLRKFDLAIENLTPKPRYLALIQAIKAQLRDGENAFQLRLQGIDELHIRHDTPLMEACNTSYQVHLQVTPETFVPLYNISQAIAAPILGIAANSPIVFGKRLWHESRIALFQQALDVRNSRDHLRQPEPRVSFGTDWLRKSIMEIYKEDIARYRVLLGSPIDQDSLALIKAGKTPKLRALQVHNGTVYRWNRPCYGISPNGKPHLRIENRVLPAGPTILDQTANAAFWLGTMIGLGNKYKDITEHMAFADAKDNFAKAAQFGMDTHFTWFDNKKISCRQLILEELLPAAEQGLRSRGIDREDVDRYLGVIRQRAEGHQNGARWQLKAFTNLSKRVSRDEAQTIITSHMIKCQTQDHPVHEWEQPRVEDLKNYRPVGLRVEEFMETDLFTVQETDLLELVADMMNWRKLRYVPVEDANGHLCGLITTRKLLRYYIQRGRLDEVRADVKTVGDLMISNPTTIPPETTIKDAMNMMRDNRLGCLPVIKEEELVGIITEMDFLRVAGRLIDRLK